MACFSRGINFVSHIFTSSTSRETFGNQQEENPPRSQTLSNLRTCRISRCRWLFVLSALAISVNVHASSGYILQWGNGPLPPPHPYYESLSAADLAGRGAVVASGISVTGWSGLYVGLVTGPFPYGTEEKVNWWYDDDTYTLSGLSLGPVRSFLIQEVVCKNGYVWDNTTHTCVTPPRCKNSIGVGKPCDAATGNERYTVTDYTGTGPFPLTFTRTTYNSKISSNGRMGFNWVSNYGDPAAINSLTLNVQATPNIVSVPRPNGEYVFFQLLNGVWTPNADNTDTLTQTANGWIYAQSDGTTETYDNVANSLGNSTGRLLSIANRTGVTHTLSRDPITGYLRAVTDPFGHSLTFTYDTKGRLSTMTDPVSGITTYTYDDTNGLPPNSQTPA
jgi:YD repeat-containing protein